MSATQVRSEHEIYAEFEIGRLRKRAERAIRRIHEVAMTRAIRDAFPELRNKRVIVFVEGDDIDYELTNSKIISDIISRNTKVERITLSDAVSNYKERVSNSMQIHPIFLDMMFRSNPHDNRMPLSITTLNSILKELSGKGKIGIPPFSVSIGGKAENESKMMTEVNISLADLQISTIANFVEELLNKAENEQNKILLIEYTPSINFYVMKNLIDELKMRTPKSIYAFVDKAVYLDRDIVELMNSSYSSTIVTDSIARFRKLAHRYLYIMRNYCFTLSERYSVFGKLRKNNEVNIIREIGFMLKFMIERGLDIDLVHEISTQVDTAPGVLFKVLNSVIVDLYVRIKKKLPEFPNIKDMKKFEQAISILIPVSVQHVVENYSAYSVEPSKEIYDHYMNILGELTGKERPLLAKTMYILSLYSQIQRSCGVMLLISETSLTKYVMNFSQSEEPISSPAVADIVDALKRLGFIDVAEYADSRIILILRPLLLDMYAYFIEKEYPELKQLKETVIEDFMLKFRDDIDTRLLPIVENIFNEKSSHNVVPLANKVLIDGNIYEELNNPIKMNFYIHRAIQNLKLNNIFNNI